MPEIESLPAESGDPVQSLHQAFTADNAPLFRRLLERFPEAKAKINEPVAAFDSPAILHVRSPQMLDVLLEAGADLNAKSRWWAGGFGLLHVANPDLAAYAIRRGAVVDAHAAARLGMRERLAELVAANPALVHAPGGGGRVGSRDASPTTMTRTGQNRDRATRWMGFACCRRVRAIWWPA